MPETPNKPATTAPASDSGHPEDPLRDRRIETMRKAIIPSIVADAVHLDKHVSTPTVGAYMDDFAQRAGGIDDPVEEVIVRQIAQADLIIGQLLAQTTRAQNAPAAQTYGNTACRLIAEVRRLALALKQYRSSDESRKTTIVHQVTHVGQQNIATKQDVAYTREGSDEADGEGRVSMKCEDSKLSNRSTHEDRFTEEESSTRRRRQAEPCEA